MPLGLTLIEAQKHARRAEQLAVLKTFAEGELLRRLPFRSLDELLEIVTAIAGDIEDAGDDLVNGFSRYKKGRHTFQGGGYLSDLMRAVVHFINRWGRTKGGRLSLEILRAITALAEP